MESLILARQLYSNPKGHLYLFAPLEGYLARIPILLRTIHRRCFFDGGYAPATYF